MPSDADLLATFSPVLRYDSRELYFADSAATLTGNVFDGGPMRAYANVLRREDKSVIASAAAQIIRAATTNQGVVAESTVEPVVSVATIQIVMRTIYRGDRG